MQRWIAIGVVAMILVLGGGAFGYRALKQNHPAPIWVPMAMNPDASYEKRSDVAKEVKAKLLEKEVLVKVSQDLGLAKQWGLPSDAAAADELGKRLFVDVGEMDSPDGKVPSMNVGVRGKLKEKDLSGKIAVRLMTDVWNILGIKPTPQK